MMLMVKRSESETKIPPTEVQPRAKRRVFSIEFKRSIVEQAAACSEPGAIGAMLRSKGLYSSQLTDWRREHEAGNLKGYGRLRRGPLAPDKALPAATDEMQQRIEQLERENQRLRLRAVKAEALVEFQKKAACLLGAEVDELRDDVC
jgi:transposase-like protein